MVVAGELAVITGADLPDASRILNFCIPDNIYEFCGV